MTFAEVYHARMTIPRAVPTGGRLACADKNGRG